MRLNKRLTFPHVAFVATAGPSIGRTKFLKALASCGCITDACRAVGMSRESAHNLYNDPRAKDFRAAFDAALDCAMPAIESGAWERAIKGVPRPVFYQGEQVGEYRQYNE